MNIVLIGYRGTGKSEVGRILAARLKITYIGMDVEIENRAGMSIPEIVKKYGWPGFRDLESAVVRDLSGRDHLIIDTGGGVIERSENIEFLKNNAIIFWLKASVDVIVSRIFDSTQRPALINGKTFTEEVAEVLDRRIAAYRSAADHEIDTDPLTPAVVAEQIVELLTDRQAFQSKKVTRFPSPINKEALMPQQLSADVLAQQVAMLEKELAKSRENEARLEKILSDYTSLFENSEEVTRDITDRKMAESALRENEKKYRLLFESIRSGIVYLEAIYDDAGKVCDARYIEMNAVYQQYTGLNRENAIGRTVMEMLPGTQKSWIDTLDITIKKGKLIRFEMYHEGTQKHYAVSAYSPDKNMVVGVFRDITREKEMERSLKQNEEKYRLIVENQTDLVVKVDTEGAFLFVSPSFCKMFGKTEEQLLGRQFMPLVHEEDRESAAAAIESLYRPPHTAYMEQRDLTADGWRWFDWVHTAVLDENHQVVSILGVGRDINDKKLAEQEKLEMQEKLNRSKKMEAMGLMAGGVAHDLNNILSSVISYPELMLMNPLFPDNFRRPVERIKEGGLRAAAIVADLLTIARGVASRKEVGNINDIISAYLNSFEHMDMMETCSGVSIEKALDPHLHNISCSPVHVRKVLMNLVVNAIESVKSAGKIEISSRNQYLDKPLRGYDDVRAGAYAVLSVADNGAGIPSEDMEHIFEPFYSKKKMGRSGTGLGLTVVWNTVQDHQGYVHVYSGTGGARFDLYFPASVTASTDTDESVDRASFKSSGQRILVVDDEERQREIARQLLTELGYQVETADSGEKALVYLQNNSVDLIILDMIMGSGMNGCQTYQEIVRIRPGQKAIIASGFAETADVREAQRLGAGAFVKKPYTVDKIGAAIKTELLR